MMRGYPGFERQRHGNSRQDGNVKRDEIRIRRQTTRSNKENAGIPWRRKMK
jgi:hypothetical protein